MKTSSFAKLAGGLALLAVSSVAMASVVNTKHNLGATGTAGNHTTGTTEICIFCHTPHGGDQSTTAPIWNRATNTGGDAIYQRFSALGRLTFDAKEAPIGSVSAACLSCHDGTQAIDAVINSSGSDSTSGISANQAGNGGFSQGRAMGNGSFVAADGSWDGVATASGTRGDMVYLGTDLRNDHPISMQYGGGGIDSSAGGTNHKTNDPDFAQPVGAPTATGFVTVGHPGGLIGPNGTFQAGAPSNAGANNTTGDAQNTGAGIDGSGTGAIVYQPTGPTGTQPRWFVDTDNGNAYNSKDFPLYTRAATDADGGVVGSAAAQPTVECGTCHDPHSGNSTFLRLVGGNQGSQVCLTCHAK